MSIFRSIVVNSNTVAICVLMCTCSLLIAIVLNFCHVQFIGRSGCCCCTLCLPYCTPCIVLPAAFESVIISCIFFRFPLSSLFLSYEHTHSRSLFAGGLYVMQAVQLLKWFETFPICLQFVTNSNSLLFSNVVFAGSGCCNQGGGSESCLAGGIRGKEEKAV